MVIMHNLAAMNSNRMYNITNSNKASVTEKLSSGYRINRAADDAAGLSISEKMRRQIRGLSQASLNSQDGVSLIQLADGAMTEIHEMLQRGNELCVKAANGTLTDIDREFIQEEIEHLKIEIDSLSERTTFNEIQVLRGGTEPEVTISSGNAIIQGGFPTWATVSGIDADGYMSGTYENKKTFEAADGTQTQYTIPHVSSTIDFSSFDGSAAKKKELIGQGFYTTCCTCTRHYSIKFTNETTNSVEQSGLNYIFNIGIGNAQSAEDIVNAIVQGTTTGTSVPGKPNNHYTVFEQDANNAKKLVVYDVRSSAANPAAGQAGTWTDWSALDRGFNTSSGMLDGYGSFGVGVAYSGEDFEKFRSPVDVFVQVGSESGQHLEIELPEITALSLGVHTVDVTTQESAGMGISFFKKALQYVSTERSRLGACQNRLEHTINNLNNVVENTQAAESAIRDADMASEMVKFSNMNILAQAGEAMLAQANRMNQGVLSLLGQ